MKKIALILLTALTIINCKQEKNYTDRNKFYKILGQMTADDQKYRGLPEMKDPIFGILDSLKRENNLSNSDYGKLTAKEQLDWGKKPG
jgi:hypothetical protein